MIGGSPKGLASVITVTAANAQAVLGGTIDSSKLYEIDGVIDMGSTPITVPSTGIQIRGLGMNVSHITSSADGYTMFVGDTAGDVFIVGPANDQIELRWMRYQDSTATSAVVPNSNQTAQITRLLGLRDVSYVDMLAPVVTLDKGDYVWLQIQNLSSSGNLTAETGSRARVEAL